MSVTVRRAKPADAPALVELAEAVSSEPEGWLIAEGAWRSVGEERRYLRLLIAMVVVIVLSGFVLGFIAAFLSGGR